MTAQKPPAGGKPATQDDDPWSRLARENQAAARGENPDLADLGDTASLLHRGRGGATVSESEGPSTEILQLVSDSLAAEPERADLWTMRFEVQKSLGLKQEFADALVQGWRNPRVARGVDWSHVRALWEELAPGEPVPGGVRLPQRAETPRPAAPPAPTLAAPQRAARNRRFADVAVQLAGRELAVFAKAYAALHSRPGFLENMARKVAPRLKRPTPLQLAQNLSRTWGAHVRVLLKREDQRQVSPEEENATAQAYIAALLGRPHMITGNDVDAHSLALARVAPQFKLGCTIVVRASDLTDRPAFVAELRALGATVEPIPPTGMLTRDPREAALRLWQKSLGHAYLAMSLGTGPAPYPAMSNHFQSLLGRETELQLRTHADKRPRTMIAAVQSEGDSIGYMLPQLSRQDVELLYAEPEPGGVASWRPSARLRAYNGVVREHAWLRGLGRIEHVAIPDVQALEAQRQISALEGIEVSLEDARALALAQLMAQRDPNPRDFVVLVA